MLRIRTCLRLCLVAPLLLASVSWADHDEEVPEAPAASSGKATRTDYYFDPQCITDPTDPFPSAYRMTEGIQKGRCIDSSERRTVRLLTPEEAAPYKPGPDEYVIANFWYAGKFWIAKIKKDAAERKDWMIEDFGKVKVLPKVKVNHPLSHTFVRYKIKADKPIQLIPQIKGVYGPPKALKDDLAISVDGVGPEGFGSVNPIKSLFKDYALAYRFEAMTEKGSTAIDQKHRKLNPIPMIQKGKDLDDNLEFLITDADSRSMHHMYNLFTGNCTSEAYRYADATPTRPLGTQVSKFTQMVENWDVRHALKYLRKRNLVDEDLEKTASSYNDEYLQNRDQLLKQVQDFQAFWAAAQPDAHAH